MEIDGPTLSSEIKKVVIKDPRFQEKKQEKSRFFFKTYYVAYNPYATSS